MEVFSLFLPSTVAVLFKNTYVPVGTAAAKENDRRMGGENAMPRVCTHSFFFFHFEPTIRAQCTLLPALHRQPSNVPFQTTTIVVETNNIDVPIVITCTQSGHQRRDITRKRIFWSIRDQSGNFGNKKHKKISI